MRFQGFDHVDLRVPSLAAVESFYDALLRRLGLTQKKYSFVDAHGDWHAATAEAYNTVEWVEETDGAALPAFFGVIEEQDVAPSHSRVAFRVREEELDGWVTALHEIGAREVQRNEEESYPAIFFTDPLGTRLEVVARRPSR
ncbi:MAG: VOC family protein [Candidatus Eremiobacteraeota bacterium]|nr:VOC family protein [Candidatus Eremiobacteraeota bacterium]